MAPKTTKKKQPEATPVAAPQQPPPLTLGEQLSYLHIPKPFKNPRYTKNASRRAKNLKTVLSQEKERERAERERRRLERDAAAMNLDGEQQPNAGAATSSAPDRMDVDSAERPHTTTLEEDDMPTYSSIEAAPSFLPQRHYCDITGLEAPYTDPVTNLRYHDKSVYGLIKNLSPSIAKEYLAARGVAPVLK